MRVEESYKWRNVGFVVKKGGLTFVVFGGGRLYEEGLDSRHEQGRGMFQQSKSLGLLREF